MTHPSPSLLITLLIALCLAPLAACDRNENDPQISPPLSSSSIDDQHYKDLVIQFEEAGFTDVTTEPIPDLITGWITSDGEVEDISIGGSTDFAIDDDFAPTTPVIIRYHTFPPKETKRPKQAPTNESPTPATTHSTPPLTPDPTPSTTILTIDNNSDLATILTTKDPLDPSIATFANTYQGQLIEFDGFVADVAPHGNYENHFDYLILAGDFNPSTEIGPYFQFSNINYTEFNFPEGSAPESVPEGVNLHIVAKVGKYTPQSGLFQLDPVSTTIR